MKKFNRVRDVLDYAHKFHHQVSNLYNRISEFSGDERIKLMLDYLSRHERNIESQLIEFEQIVDEKILDSWFGFLPEETDLHCLEEISFSPYMSLDDITDIALEIDDCLLNVYKRIATGSENHKIREIFQNLYDMGDREKHKIVLSSQRLKTL